MLTVLMTYAYGRPNLRNVPEPDTPISIELNIPKPPGVMRADSDGLTPVPVDPPILCRGTKFGHHSPHCILRLRKWDRVLE